MANNILRLPYDYFFQDSVGKPIALGKLYVGEPDTNPKIFTNRKSVTVRQEDGTEITLTAGQQPLRTGAGGGILYQGSPVEVLVNGAYSLRVDSSEDEQIYLFSDVTDGAPVSIDQVWIKHDTVADMIADSSLGEGDLVKTGGYTSVGDFGNNDYEIVAEGTGTDDGGTYIDLDNNLQARGLFPNDVITVNQYGAVGDDDNDDTAAIQAAIDHYTALLAVGDGATIRVPMGVYKTTSQILMKAGVELVGDNFHSPGSRISASLIKAYHDDVAVISFKGAHACRLEQVGVEIASGFEPKTHLLLGRDTTASAGLHRITGVFTRGVASVAAVYCVASERVKFEHCQFDLSVGATGTTGLFIGQSDFFSVDDLVSSSNVDYTFINVDVKNRVDDAGSYGIYIRAGGSTGAIAFYNCYQHQATGAYVALNNGQVDGKESLGGITFDNQCGEIIDLGTSNSPVYGFYIFGTQDMRGLTIKGGRMAQLGGVSPETIFTDQANPSPVGLTDCIINLPQNKTGTQSDGTLITSTISIQDRSYVNHEDVSTTKSIIMNSDTSPLISMNIDSVGIGEFSAASTSLGMLATGTNESRVASDDFYSRYQNDNMTIGLLSTGLPGDPTNASLAGDKFFDNGLFRVQKPGSEATSVSAIEQYYNGTSQFVVQNDGDVFNTNGTYSTLSDRNIKENISYLDESDVQSQIDDFKAYKFARYDLIETPDKRLLGLIALDVEEISPSLVTERDGIKAIKQSILHQKGMVVLQDLLKRVEELENKS